MGPISSLRESKAAFCLRDGARAAASRTVSRLRDPSGSVLREIVTEGILPTWLRGDRAPCSHRNLEERKWICINLHLSPRLKSILLEISQAHLRVDEAGASRRHQSHPALGTSGLPKLPASFICYDLRPEDCQGPHVTRVNESETRSAVWVPPCDV